MSVCLYVCLSVCLHACMHAYLCLDIYDYDDDDDDEIMIHPDMIYYIMYVSIVISCTV